MPRPALPRPRKRGAIVEFGHSPHGSGTCFVRAPESGGGRVPPCAIFARADMVPMRPRRHRRAAGASAGCPLRRSAARRRGACFAACPGRLTPGTNNGNVFTSRVFRARLNHLGITHRRGGFRDPESGLHRVLILRLARGVRDPQPGPRCDRRLHRRYQHRPTPGLPTHPTRGRPHLAGSRRTATLAA